MYYLQSRYYDPVICRFINADGYVNANGGILGFNMYAYCNNNPVMYSDPNGEFVLRILVGTLCYIGISIASIISEDIRKDMNDIGWNPFNSDENIVLDSKKVSFYKGVPVFRVDSDRSGSFGAIFLRREATDQYGVLKPLNDPDEVRHEYGHTIQLELMGPIAYGLYIGLPSYFEWSKREYYNRPWEITADVFGGVKNRNHTTEDLIRGWCYLPSGLLGYLFLFGEY